MLCGVEEMKELAGLGDPCRDRERRDSWPAAVFQVSPLSSILPLNVNEKGNKKDQMFSDGGLIVSLYQ